MPAGNQVAPLTELPVADLTSTVTFTRAEWVQKTSMRGYVRSTELQALDKALEDYHKLHEGVAALAVVERAYQTWIDKTPDTKRNRLVVSQLGLQILSAQTFADDAAKARPRNPALEALQDLMADSARRTFLDPKWVKEAAPNFDSKPRYRRIVRKQSAAELAKTAADLKDVQSLAATIRENVVHPDADRSAEMQAALGQLCEGTNPAELFTSQAAFEAFCAAASTVIGLVTSPAALMVNIASAISQWRDQSKIEESRNNFSFDPRSNVQDAFKSVTELTERALAASMVDVAKSAATVTSLCVPLAGLPIGVAGAAAASLFAPTFNAIVGVSMRAKLLAIERQEMAAGQKCLDEGRIDASLFRACPLLGAYLLNAVDVAALVNWSSEDIYNKNFPDMVKTLRQGSEAAVAAAGNLIRKSDYELEGMQGLKGLKTEPEFKAHTLEYLAKHLTLAAFAKKVSKLARRGNAVAPEPAQPVDAFKEFLQLDAKTVADGTKARDDQMAQDAAAAPDVNLFAKAGALGALAAGNLQRQPETPQTGIGIETPHGSGTKGKAGAGKEGTDDDDDNPDGDPIEGANGSDPIVDGVVEQ